MVENYKESNEYLQHMEHLQNISESIKALHSTILSLYLGLRSENVQEQALDAIKCIGVCVKEISNELEQEI